MADEPTTGGTPGRESMDAGAFMDRVENAVSGGTNTGRDAAIQAYLDLNLLQRATLRVAASVTPQLAETYLNRKLGHGGPEDLRRIGVDDFVLELGSGNAYLAQDLRDARAAATGDRPAANADAGASRAGDQPPAPSAPDQPARAGDHSAGQTAGQTADQAYPAAGAGAAGGAAAGQAAARAAFGDAVQPLTRVDPSATAGADPAAKKGTGPQRGTELGPKG